VAYRAFVRAKVACLRAAQGDPAAQLEARACVRIALHHLRAAQVRLVLVGGLPGVGKSTVAAGVADRMQAVVFRSDVIRKEFAFLGPDESGPAPYRSGLYEPEVTEATYRALLDDARAVLERGESVVLDASWSDRAWRDRAVELAEGTYSDLTQLYCVAPGPVAAHRLRERVGDVSDADPAIAVAMAAAFAPWPSATVIDTTGTVEAAVATAYAAVARDFRPWAAPALA
jgi:predicted kinase